MSAALVILPRIWATEDVDFGEGSRWLMQSSAASAGLPAEGVSSRKGPQALRLVPAGVVAGPVALAAASQAASPVAVAAASPIASPVLRPRTRPELAFYRKYTEGMLQRYMKLSLEAGRVPSLMGRELFRGDVSHCKVSGFDDVVIFVHDMGKCLGRLSPGLQPLVRRIAMQGYSHAETAALLGLSQKTVSRRYAGALDQLTGLLLEGRLLVVQGERLSGTT